MHTLKINTNIKNRGTAHIYMFVQNQQLSQENISSFLFFIFQNFLICDDNIIYEETIFSIRWNNSTYTNFTQI